MSLKGKGPVVYADTGTTANVSSSATNVTLLAANSDRGGLVIHNDSTAILFVKFGATAVATDYTYEMGPGDHLEILEGLIYTGIVDGIWASANGAARVTELT